MNTNEMIQLKRDCEATQIPLGAKMVISKGTAVRITQALGGTYTVVTDHGYMVRISEKDADALGKEVSKVGQNTAQTVPVDEGSVKEAVWNQMKTCYDPEIPVNIVDLGLVYACDIKPLSEEGYQVDVKMTLTAPGCGMGESLKGDVALKILTVPGVKTANVELVWEPQWDQSKMSEAAKLKLNML